MSPYSPFPHFPQYTSFACFLLPNTRKQFCILIVFIFSWDFQSSREKCKQCLCKTICVCWGARNMQTNCIMGNVEMANTISPYKTSKQLLTFVMVTRGDWLWKAANINYKNNGAVVYVGSSLKVHNPLFSFGKLWQNKLMQRFYWSIWSKRWECFWTLCTFRATKTYNKGVWQVS